MTRRTFVIAGALAVLLGGCGRDGDTGTGTATGTGTKVVTSAGVDRPRVVSLTPSATEVVAMLGGPQILIGVDDYSTYPPEVASLPKVGSFLTPNLEAIAALHPTLVVVDDIHGKAAKALEQLGIETVACPMHSLPDVKAALTRIGAAIGQVENAAARVDAIDQAIDATAALRKPTRPRVLIVIDRTPGELGGLVAAGPGSWLDELVAIVGGENVLAGASVRYPKISREEILRAQPDVIIDATFVANDAEPGKDWAGLDVPAVRNARVRPAKQAYLLAPSPRVADALAAVSAMLR